MADALDTLVDELRERVVIGGGVGHVYSEELERLVTATIYHRWEPIETAPVEHHTKVPSYYRFRCLLQNECGEVCEGWAYWANPPRGGTKIQRWKSANDRQSYPKYWMPLPAPKVQADG